jgi:sigma-54-specific transcriptional regulator
MLTFAEPDAAASLDAQRTLEAVLASLAEEGVPRLFHTVEEALVRAAFAQSGDNQVRAARLLGITRNSLRTLLKRYGLIGAEPIAAKAPALSLAH